MINRSCPHYQNILSQITLEKTEGGSDRYTYSFWHGVAKYHISHCSLCKLAKERILLGEE